MWASVALSGKAPFKAMFGYETLKDEKGEEMHKSKGNAIWLDEAVEKTGADPMRLLYCLQNPSQDLKFGFNIIKEPKNNINILSNLNRLVSKIKPVRIVRVEDKWILSRLHGVIEVATKELEELHPHLAIKAVQDFWLNDLSRRYIQFVRERLAEDDKEALFTLGEVYKHLIKLCAPFIPFVSEEIWQELLKKSMVPEESIHLCHWPKVEKKLVNSKLESEFEIALKIIESGLAERDKAHIGLRWPLKEAEITAESDINNKILDIIARQLNVKSVSLKKGKEVNVKLDTTPSKQLEAEGFARELSRKVQSERKKAGLKKGELITLKIFVDNTLKSMLQRHLSFIEDRTNSNRIIFVDDKISENSINFDIKDKKISMSFS
jgi:isoleucyl-tRNA synthetase